jgi:hypothetical protein
MLSLNLLGKNRFWSKEHWKENLIKIMFFSVIPLAFIAGIIDYFEINEFVKLLLGSSLTGLSLILICGVKNKKDFGKIIAFGVTAFIIFLVVDLINGIIIIFGAKVDISEFNTSPYLNFFIGMPERIGEYVYLTYKFITKNNLSQIEFNELITQNKQLRYILIGFSTISLIMLAVIIKFIFLSNILEPLRTRDELFITILCLSSVIFIMTVPWLIAMNIYSNEKYLKKHGKEESYYEE